MDKGWIKLHRQLQECCIWQKNEPFDSRSAWIDLLLSATHKQKKIIIDNEPVFIERGSFMTSILKISDRWKWSRGKVNRYLELLESEGMIRTERTPKGTLITIEKYSVFQDDKQPEEAEVAENVKKSIQSPPKTEQPREKTLYFPEDERLEMAFREFLTMRTRIKKPLSTSRGITRAINKVRSLSNGDNDMAIKILEQSVDHCWQDVWPLKGDSGNSRQSNNNDQFQKLMEQIRSDEENDS